MEVPAYANVGKAAERLLLSLNGELTVFASIAPFADKSPVALESMDTGTVPALLMSVLGGCENTYRKLVTPHL